MGAYSDFGWYLAGESSVRADTLAQMERWLLDCHYATDPELFHERDHWQHPSEFEQLRRGDCEDFAVWAWRKLIERGYDAELVVGRYAGDAGLAGGHAWIVYRQSGRLYVFDPVVRDPARMIRPLKEVRHCYCPEFSVDAGLRRFVYDGYLIRLRRIDRGRILLTEALHRGMRFLLPVRRATYRLMHRSDAAPETPAPAHSIS